MTAEFEETELGKFPNSPFFFCCWSAVGQQTGFLSNFFSAYLAQSLTVLT